MSKGLTSRRRNTPWIQRWARPIIGAIAGFGMLNTAYLTITKLTETQAVCPNQGCEQVLSSPYATVFGLPLSLYGFLAYTAMAILALGPLAVDAQKNKELRASLENTSWILMFAQATAMVIFSGYLMNIMFTKFVIPNGPGAICYYCVASAFFALSLFVLTLLGRSWEDIGQLLLIGVVVGIVTLIGTLGVYAPIDSPKPQQTFTQGVGWTIQNTSSDSEIQLARHLKQTGAKMFSAFTCPHCHEQKELFGREAAKDLPYVECHPEGKNTQTELCQKANIPGFPTWEVNGQRLVGRQTLETLANASGYKGPRNFKNQALPPQ